MLLLIVLGAASGLCWGTGDFLGGLQSRRLPVLSVLLWSQIAGCLLLLAVLAALHQPPVVASLAWGAGAGLFGAVALSLFYQGLAVGAMSIVAPVSACGAIVPVAVAFATGHVPPLLTNVGIAVAITGIVLVSLHPEPGIHPAGRPRFTLALSLGAALGFGMFYILLHQGSGGGATAPLWATAGVRIGSLSMVTAIILARRRPVVWPGSRTRWIVLAGLLDTTANLLFAYASIQGNLGIAAVLGSLYPVTTVLLSRIVLSERLNVIQNAGVGLALVGVALLSTGGG